MYNNVFNMMWNNVTLLKIENNSSWVNFIHILEKTHPSFDIYQLSKLQSTTLSQKGTLIKLYIFFSFRWVLDFSPLEIGPPMTFWRHLRRGSKIQFSKKLKFARSWLMFLLLLRHQNDVRRAIFKGLHSSIIR